MAITVERREATDGRPALELRRSTRRRKTVNAYARGDTVVLQLPAGMSHVAEQRIIDNLVERLAGRDRAGAEEGDAELQRRARRLADAYVDGVRPRSVTWSSRMRRLHGACATLDGAIRINEDLSRVPDYVLDYVLVHELAHLIVPEHDRRFHEIVARYPETERAKGFLEGMHLAGVLVAS